MATSTAEGLGRDLSQPEIDRIEFRLSLNGGSQLEEIAADLTNRFGKSTAQREKAEALRDRVTALRRTRRVAQANGDLDEVDSLTKQITVTEGKGDPKDLLAKAKELRRKEKSVYAGAAIAYIEDIYGEPVKMDGIERGYGSGMRLQQLFNQFGQPTGHLKKAW